MEDRLAALHSLLAAHLRQDWLAVEEEGEEG
jgi:hypothetical protein